MAKLITSHDPFHIHKVVGLFVLLNFACRVVLFFWRGYAICEVGNEECSLQEIRFDLACLALHACLSWSSLLLPLPEKRNFNAPMIWREFRWHSIIFATRTCVATVVSILGWWPEHWLLNYASKLALIMGTCKAADLATRIHGSKTKRTTNAMPYPDYVTPALQQKIKLNYSMSQMMATLSCATESATWNFFGLYAIQGAAFLMTLRRKNLISTRTYHFIYQVLLCAVYLPPLLGLVTMAGHEYWIPFFPFGFIAGFALYLRVDRGRSKMFVWAVCLGIWQLVMRSQACHEVLVWFHTNPVGLAYVVFSHLNEDQRILNHYLPIWLGRAPIEDFPKKPYERQSLVRDLQESDMLTYPNRSQRFAMVFAALLGTHFQGLEVAKKVVEAVGLVQ